MQESKEQKIVALKDAHAKLLELISGSSNTLDLNELVGAIEQNLAFGNDYAELSADCRVLKQDFSARIVNMERAIAVANDRTPDIELLEELINSDKIRAERLLKLHRIVSARFRDTFPSRSFSSGSNSTSRVSDWSDYSSNTIQRRNGQRGPNQIPETALTEMKR
ncbi:MAG: hypothetical protein IIB00_07240 [candidate division Zixibacteria bacterium]|nr:hypothetical protein [candidate division Zixibacteria bacterium]